MRLRDVPFDSVIEKVTGLADECRSLAAGLVGPADAGWHAYLDWVDRCERQLRNLFDEPEFVARLHTDRYWNISSFAAPARMKQLIDAEIEVQARRLEEVANRLRGYRRLRERQGTIAVIDTNALLHHQRIDRIPWAQVVGSSPVRLVVPLRVLQELDEKGYTGTEKIRRRAASAVVPLDERQEALDQPGYASLTDDTTVEYLTDERGHRPQPRSDEEILDRAEFLHQVTGQPVVVITGDRNMRARLAGRRSGLRAVLMPSRFRRDQDTPEDDEAAVGD